jgi:hypothetical protein
VVGSAQWVNESSCSRLGIQQDERELGHFR